MAALPVLGLGLHLPVLGIGLSIRQVSLSDYAREIGEQSVGGRAFTVACICHCGRNKAQAGGRGKKA